MLIDRERLATTFTTLCEIESPSRHEGRIAEHLKEVFGELGADEIIEDSSAATTGSEANNLIFRFHGHANLEPLFFSTHMDTVQPCTGVKVQRTGDMFTSKGETILGSDDKSGIAACIEAMSAIRQHGLTHAPVEFVITTCEELGLGGAKALDPSLIRARQGYALDTSGFGRVVIAAPAANRITVTVQGIAAHAGLHPEHGINAIQLASRAINRLRLGRIDAESTVNIGTIHGGAAHNIIPETVVLAAEVRSHNLATLERLTLELETAFLRTIEEWQDPTGQAKGRPEVEVEIRDDYPRMRLDPGHPVIERVDRAAKAIGLEMRYEVGGGGSDANIFNGHGLATPIIATGMTDVHSTNEHVELGDMVDLSRLIVSLLTEQAI